MNQLTPSELTERVDTWKLEPRIVAVPEFKKYLESTGWVSEPESTPDMYRHKSGHSQVVTIRKGYMGKALQVVAEFEKRSSYDVSLDIMGQRL